MNNASIYASLLVAMAGLLVASFHVEKLVGVTLGILSMFLAASVLFIVPAIEDRQRRRSKA